MEKTTIRIRKGLSGYPFSTCTTAGYFISNFDSVEQIREHYKFELRRKSVELVKELHLFPEGEQPKFITYGYARVSTKGQASDGNSLEAQRAALTEAGAQIIFEDAYTGKTTDRPEFTKLMSVIKGGDTLVITKLDRFARSINQANELITELINKRVRINVLNIGVIDNSPTSKLMRTMLLAFAEFERDMIIERTREGKDIARQKEGFKDGRPLKYTEAQMKHAVALLKDHSYNQVSEMTGISKSTLTRIMRKHKSKDIQP